MKRATSAAGAGVGSAAGGFFNNPGIVAIVAILGGLGIALLFFQNDIRKFFEGLGQVTLPEIKFPDITFPEFPTITFPDFPEINIAFPDFPDFGAIFGLNGGGNGGQVPPGEIDGVTIPEGCTVDEQGRLDCPTPPTFDVCSEFPELCEECAPGQVRIGGICQAPPGRPLEPTVTPIEEPPPSLELPPGFEGGGPSFEGGTIFERDPCFMTLNEIIEAGLATSASGAANVRAIACSENVTQEPSDFPPGFDFGTNVPGATTESEAQRAACTSCELFGLNCPICRGEVGA